MTLIQTLPLVTMSVALFAALFHLYMYIKNIGDRTDLSFTWVCLYLFCFAWLCYLNYTTAEFEENVVWIKLIYITFPVFPVTFIHFAFDFTRQPSRRIPWILSGAGLAVMIMMLAVLVFSPGETPVYIRVDMADFSYAAFQGSVMVEGMKILLILFTYGVNTYGIVLIFKHYRSGHRAAGPILAGALLFFVCGVNDTFIETGVYSFVYLTEYGGMFLIFGMTIALINQMAETHREMSQVKVLSAIGRMATYVVHDLTSPLDAIKLAASIARKNGNGSDIREQYLSMIETETRRLSDLSFDILTFVNNNGALNKQAVNLKAYMREVSFQLQEVFRSHAILFRCILDYEGTAHLDPDAFKRIILNLAANARECLSKHPSAQKTPEFTLGVTKQAKHIVFTFSDNGPGIPGKIKPHLFEPFTSYGKTFGTGLGLAISKQIVDRHGGTISFESENGQGTTIRISLPDSNP